MANTVTVTISANYVGNGLTANSQAENEILTISTNAAPEGTLGFTVPTTAAAIPLGGVSSPRLLFVQNLDATNYVTIYRDSGLTTPIARLNPGNTPGGDVIWLPIDPSITAPYWAAHTATCEVNYRVFGT